MYSHQLAWGSFLRTTVLYTFSKFFDSNALTIMIVLNGILYICTN